jgi:hypothetical protein
MFWRLFTQEFLTDEDGCIGDVSANIEYEEFDSFRQALFHFNLAVAEDKNARVWIKAYCGKSDTQGDIMTAFSVLWHDNLFNESAI